MRRQIIFITQFFVFLLIPLLPGAGNGGTKEVFMYYEYINNEVISETSTLHLFDIINNTALKCVLIKESKNGDTLFGVYKRPINNMAAKELNIYFSSIDNEKLMKVHVEQKKKLLSTAGVFAVGNRVTGQYFSYSLKDIRTIEGQLSKLNSIIDEIDIGTAAIDFINGANQCGNALKDFWDMLGNEPENIFFKNHIVPFLIYLNWRPDPDMLQNEQSLLSYGKLYRYNTEYRKRYFEIYYNRVSGLEMEILVDSLSSLLFGDCKADCKAFNEYNGLVNRIVDDNKDCTENGGSKRLCYLVSKINAGIKLCVMEKEKE